MIHHSEPCPICQVELVTGCTNREMRQWFTIPDNHAITLAVSPLLHAPWLNKQSCMVISKQSTELTAKFVLCSKPTLLSEVAITEGKQNKKEVDGIA